MGLHDLYEFDLVADPGTSIATDRWTAMQHRLLELQPARSATLVGDPPDRIHVTGYGGTEVAPGLLDYLIHAAGTGLRVVPTEM